MKHRNLSEGEYLAFLAVKNGVDPEELFQALVSTRERKSVKCGSLFIQCRGKNRSGRIFLISNDSKVVAQVRIREEFLSERTNPIVKFMNCERIRRYFAKEEASSLKMGGIGGLRAGMTGINLSAKVLKVGEPNSIQTRNGNPGVIANALIADDTGTMKLSLWGGQISSINVGDTVQITNGRVLTFRGEKQLRVGRNGTIKVESEHSVPA